MGTHAPRLFSILFALEERGDALVDEERQDRIAQTLDERERQVEDHKAAEKAVCARQDLLVHADDVLRIAGALER